jgi:vacuolar-type H+-ATPase subunit E/Vma4
MAIEDMIKRVMDEAKAENKEIILEAKMEADRIRAESGRKFEKEIFELEKGLERDIANTRNIYISDGKRKARQALLLSKEELIWDAICAIRENIKKLSGDRLGQYLVPMVTRAKEILGKDMLVYPVRDEDALVLEDNTQIQGLVSDHSGPGKPLNRYSGTDLLGGFIALTRDGDRIVDMSFHGLLERNEEKIREVIARTLFGDI